MRRARAFLLQFGKMPLHRAAMNGHAGVVEQLLKSDASVEAKDKVASTGHN